MIFGLCFQIQTYRKWFFLYIHKQVEFKILWSIVCCSIDNFINCYTEVLKSDALNIWVDAYSHPSSSGSVPQLKSCVSFHRHSLLLIKLSGVADPANRASKRIITMMCSLCGTTSIQAGNQCTWGGGYNTIPAPLMLRRQQKSQGEKFTQFCPCKETTGEVANPALRH